MQENKGSNIEESIAVENERSFLADLGVLFKFRLTLFVVMSAVMAAFISAGSAMGLVDVINLAIGGFLVTAAASTLNQVIEKDYDRKMERTKNRPLVVGNMSVSTAVLIAGIMSLVGVILLATFNTLTSFLGMISLIAYAFVYTPLKRYHHSSVQFGAIPGALPMAIGVVAVQGAITPLAILLFSLQFFWQMPHFWAIAWKSHADYVNAGFKLLPTSNNTKDKGVGLQSILYAVPLIPISISFYFFNVMDVYSTITLMLLSGWYTYKAFNLYRYANDKHATKLMFASFIYLPVALLIILIGSSIV